MSWSQHEFKIVMVSHDSLDHAYNRADKPQREGWLVVWKTKTKTMSFVDDIVLTAHSKEVLQAMNNSLLNARKDFDLTISITKDLHGHHAS